MSADPDNIASVETNPTEIDLEPIRETWQHRGSGTQRIVMALIAAVEALRERVSELEDTKEVLIRTVNKFKTQAETAQAHAIELVGALEQVKQRCLFEEDLGAIGVTAEPHIDEKLFSDICTALATLPAQALERHKALEDCSVLRGEGI